ncbi:hypothetical protein MML48_5g00010854 [Holotrichia oblita]|uniref:Uncharacterized protein n=1 Tax=Holotrichia oblita TaxID=644536 RepID=A0ACB9T4F3_HOLOL|nr:hypothetical protein MML48_5g00010854 [Holotrichia oblita]
MKIREASRMYGVPKTTLIDRLSGRVPEKLRRPGPQPLLGVEGEKKSKTGSLILPNAVFPLARICYWILREAESVNKARAIVTKEFIQKWFTDLKQYLEEQKMMDIFEDPNRIFNGDESGFALCPKSGKVLGPRGFKNMYTVKLSNDKAIITVLFFFNANGSIAPPLAIFPYIRPPRSLINNLPNNWIVGKSEKGWMTSDVFYEYIANDFHTWVLENQIKKPLLIFVDGHKSHMTLSLSKWCDKNQIVLYALPPNTTHILQPADVALFKPMKQEWKNTVKNWHSVTKLNFCMIFNAVLSKKTELANNIRNGFRKCGLCPLNEQAVDYSKCILNTTEKLTKLENRNSSEYCTKQDFRTAAKVINHIKDNLTRYGINVNVILNEITNLEESTPKRRSSDKHQRREQNSIEAHSLAQLPPLEPTNDSHDTNYLEFIENAEVVFDFNDINDPPLLTSETTLNIINDIPDVTLGSTFTQSFIDGIMVIDAENSEIVDREKICQIGHQQLLQISDREKEGNCESVSNAEYRDLIVDKENNANYNNNGRRNTDCNISDNSDETIHHKTSVLDRNTSSSLLDSVFDKHLIYPSTLTQRNRNTRNTKEKPQVQYLLLNGESIIAEKMRKRS